MCDGKYWSKHAQPKFALIFNEISNYTEAKIHNNHYTRVQPAHSRAHTHTHHIPYAKTRRLSDTFSINQCHGIWVNDDSILFCSFFFLNSIILKCRCDYKIVNALVGHLWLDRLHVYRPLIKGRQKEIWIHISISLNFFMSFFPHGTLHNIIWYLSGP